MKEVPDDIIREARDALGETWCAELGGTKGWLLRRDWIASALMAERQRATKAERERCATIVASVGGVMAEHVPEVGNLLDVIASAIRSSPESTNATP